MAQPLDSGIVQDDGGAISVPDLDSGADAASGSPDTSADTGAATIDPGITNGGGDLGAPNIDPGITNGGGDLGAPNIDPGITNGGGTDPAAGDTNGLGGGADTGGADTGDAGVVDQGGVDQGGVDQGGAVADDSGAAGADAGSAGGAKVLLPTPGPTGGPHVGVPGDNGPDLTPQGADDAGSAGGANINLHTPGPTGGALAGVPGDTGFDPDGATEAGGAAGGAVQTFPGPNLAPHTGVPGDTGIDLGDPGVAGGQAGTTNVVPDDDQGNTHFPGDTGINEDVMDQSGAAGAADIDNPDDGEDQSHGVPGDTGAEVDPAAEPGAGDLGGGDGVDGAGNAGQNAPGGVPPSAVLSDFSAGGQPGDTGTGDAGAAAATAGVPGGTDVGQVDDSGNAVHGVPGDTGEPDMGAAAATAGVPGGTDVGQVDDSGNAVHGVPGDTGVAADNPASGGNPFLNDLSTGTTGDADPGQQPEGSHDIPDVDPNSAEGGGFLGGLFGGAGDAADSAALAHNLPDEGQTGDADPGQQPEGNHDIPDVDPNSAEGGGFLGGLNGGAGDAANSAALAHNLPDEGQTGAVDPGQSGDHGGFPLLNDLAAGLTGHTDPGAAGEPGAQPAGVAGLVSSFDHILNPDAGQAASTAGGEGGAGLARDISGLTSTFDKGLSSAADHFGQPVPTGVDPGAVGGLDHPAAAASAAGGAGQAFSPEAGHGAIFPRHEGVITDPASNVHNISTPHQTIVDPGASGGVSETATTNSPLPHEMPAPGAEIGTTGHYGGENPQAFLSTEHGSAAPTQSEAQPNHEGGEDNSHVAYLHPDPEQESGQSAGSYEHHTM